MDYFEDSSTCYDYCTLYGLRCNDREFENYDDILFLEECTQDFEYEFLTHASPIERMIFNEMRND